MTLKEEEERLRQQRLRVQQPRYTHDGAAQPLPAPAPPPPRPAVLIPPLPALGGTLPLPPAFSPQALLLCTL